MQDANNNNYNNMTPYRASGNLNVSIGIPTMNVNDAMNTNIQNVNTNYSLNNVNNLQGNYNTQNVNLSQGNNAILNSNLTQSNNTVSSGYMGQNSVNQGVSNLEYNSEVNNDSAVKRTFVSNSNKKKKPSFNLGPEFKIALLIIVVLLAFVFLLPLIPSFIGD